MTTMADVLPRCSRVYVRRSSRTPSVSQTDLPSERCIPSGRASRACSANCQPFLREVVLRIPCRNASARRRGSGRAKRAAIRACKRSNSWVHRTTSVTVVLVSCDMVGEVCFKFFSFHMDYLGGEVALPGCHIVKSEVMKLF